MERIVFPRPELCAGLSKEKKQTIFHQTKDDDHGWKVPDFYAKFEHLYAELLCQSKVEGLPFKSYEPTGAMISLRFSLN
ncbi:hypothetical protein Ciccas_002580 [Cichlidogyrus casuarinus]|uniref:Uncharacterized protein n=1 Tax=Cichlidogyrus casuarinus TaxID=1844966 RepID=A0ABD2QGT3_9PLAT